jgi:NADH-quinone oxidoreductase subunit N
MAYSSIAHAGYMLIGLAVWLAARRFADAPGLLPAVSQEGLAATLLYLAIYVVASIGTFAALIYLGRAGRQIDEVDELAGLSRTHRLTALAIAAFMFSLAGIPPLAGFWGKLSLFASSLSVNVGEPAAAGVTVRTWFVVLAVVGVINAAISAAYYLRVVSTMYFRSPEGVPRAEGGWGAALATGVCVVLAVGIGFYPGPLVTSARRAVPNATMDAEATATVQPERDQPSLVQSTADGRR